jgi:hypothetical protein
MTEAKTTQIVVETLNTQSSSLRSTQMINETLLGDFVPIRTTQFVVEALLDVDYFQVISLDSIGEVIFGSLVIR